MIEHERRQGRYGELIPIRGFSRWKAPSTPALLEFSAWRSHDGLQVISSLNQAHLPGSGEPPLVGPQWHLSVARIGGGQESRPSPADVARTAECFALPAFDVDNHHPGVAWHLWCPIDERYRLACECKTSEVLVTEADGYVWSNERDGCRGCALELITARRQRCTIHSPSGSTVAGSGVEQPGSSAGS